jgi:hypothetical protein
MGEFAFLIAVMLVGAAPARADPPKVAVFDFELFDTSLQGETDGPRADEHDRLQRTAEQQACGGCDVQYARQLGADLSVTGLVQKVSNLILNMNIYVRDVHTGQIVTAMSADLRGNTDESWSRAASYLLRNQLLTPRYGAPQPQ